MRLKEGVYVREVEVLGQLINNKTVLAAQKWWWKPKDRLKSSNTLETGINIMSVEQVNGVLCIKEVSQKDPNSFIQVPGGIFWMRD